jgi:uncharacterized protein HemX
MFRTLLVVVLVLGVAAAGYYGWQSSSWAVTADTPKPADKDKLREAARDAIKKASEVLDKLAEKVTDQLEKVAGAATHKGTVMAVQADKNMLTIETVDDKTLVAEVNDKTLIRAGDKTVKLGDLKKDQPVLMISKVADGKHTALLIQAEPLSK